ncbi:hypothetical protein B0H13DRAFT_1872415 [Mycena leptocephala]|nr:hypothetical protein B0H13DRAFT_1872415 [Mycena leptocephala]
MTWTKFWAGGTATAVKPSQPSPLRTSSHPPRTSVHHCLYVPFQHENPCRRRGPGVLRAQCPAVHNNRTELSSFQWPYNNNLDQCLYWPDIDIDENLDSLLQSDPYYIINDLEAASGSATFDLPALSVGTHRIAFSSTDGFQILTEGSIEILAEGSSSIPSSSSVSSSTSTPIPTPSAPPTSSSSPPSSTKSSPPSIPTSTQSQTTSEPQKSPPVSIPPASSTGSTPSPSSSPSPSISGSTQSQPQPQFQTTTSDPQIRVTKNHSNAGTIAGGVVGATVVILLALLGRWYLSRRIRSAAANQESYGRSQTPQFLTAPVSNALAISNLLPGGVQNWSQIDEFRSWEDSEMTASSATTQSGSGPSREKLLEEHVLKQAQASHSYKLTGARYSDGTFRVVRRIPDVGGLIDNLR